MTTFSGRWQTRRLSTLLGKVEREAARQHHVHDHAHAPLLLVVSTHARLVAFFAAVHHTGGVGRVRTAACALSAVFRWLDVLVVRDRSIG